MPLRYDEIAEVEAIARRIVRENIASLKVNKPAIKPEVKIEPIAEKVVRKEVKYGKL